MDFKFKIFFIFLTTHFFHCDAAVNKYKSYNDYKLFAIENNEKINEVISVLFDIDRSLLYTRNERMTRLLVSPELAPVLQEIGVSNKVNVTLILDDFTEALKSETKVPVGSKPFGWTAYYDIDDIYGYLRNMSKEFSDWTELLVAGKSYEGRQILGLRINTPKNRGNKPVMFIEAGIHAREWITHASITYFINQLLKSTDPKIITMREQFDWHIFPCFNPDGYHYSMHYDRMWRKTRSKITQTCYGVDPNRNWDYNWMKQGASDQCNHDDYAGPKPFSEIETRTLSKYITSLKNLTGYFDFHSDAQLLMVPYADSMEHFKNYDDLIKIGKTAIEYGYKVNKVRYSGPGTFAELIYPVSGSSMDWVRFNFGTPLAFGFEMRGKSFHWPADKIYQQGDEITQMMLGVVTKAAELGYFSAFPKIN